MSAFREGQFGIRHGSIVDTDCQNWFDFGLLFRNYLNRTEAKIRPIWQLYSVAIVLQMFNGALSLFQITDYVPKYPDHWSCILFTVGLPANLELLLYYIASLSAGLAVLNVVPCFMLDGQGSIFLNLISTENLSYKFLPLIFGQIFIKTADNCASDVFGLNS
jgi:membrane-associated protease RseP (regulator of RpoE activity)